MEQGEDGLHISLIKISSYNENTLLMCVLKFSDGAVKGAQGYFILVIMLNSSGR